MLKSSVGKNSVVFSTFFYK